MARVKSVEAVERARTRAKPLIKDSAVDDAAAALDAIGAKRRSNGKRRMTAPEKLVEEIAEMRASSDWSRLRANHLVELYAILHREVYRVEAAELRDRVERLGAVSAAKAFFERQMGGDGAEAYAFVAWVWKREREREEWARTSGNARRGRVGWRLQFSAKFATDYRVEKGRGNE